MRKQVIVIGAGGHGKVVAEAVETVGDEFVGFLDDGINSENVIGNVSDCEKYTDKFFIIAIGNNDVRKKICQRYPKLNYYTLIHRTATVSDTAVIGKGSMILANTVVNADAAIGEHCIVNTSAIIEHDNVLGDFAQVSPGAVMCGTVKLGECGYIGAGAVVKNNITICSDAIVGAGAVVVKDIDVCGTYVGIPARRLKC